MTLNNVLSDFWKVSVYPEIVLEIMSKMLYEISLICNIIVFDSDFFKTEEN